ncbi:MAG TPA: bifunctional nuclease family protein [Thermoanaerobaculaceae bacterium]|nr:bifunctional nuclease family protein [Thermoanaerobaculaceae bacterium]HRS16751.1 bifunctional nuclease family protein [Thermoanaerobaculaceae bacterium]
MSDAVSRPVEVEIRGLILDPVSNTPIVILKKPNENVYLPIWIGLFEANAIALELEGVGTPRPMTHDLLRSVVECLGGRVESVVVHALVENTFHAKVLLRDSEGRSREIDSRPSDAIALALRCRAPIRVVEEVFRAAHTLDASEEDQEARLREWLESLGPDQLGKYNM